MYSPKIEPEQVGKLYFLRESLAREGVKKPITILIKEAIEEYLEKRKEENRQKRGKSMFSVGLGAGAPYGWGGVNAEVLLGGYVGVTAGAGITKSFGGRLYLSSKYAKFRPRLTFMRGAVSSYDNGINITYIDGTIAMIGFQWKFTNSVSLDIDFGQSKADESTVSSSYYRNGMTYSTSSNISSETNATGAIGLNFHF